MRKAHVIVTAASLAIGGMLIPASALVSAEDQPVNNTTGDKNHGPQGTPGSPADVAADAAARPDPNGKMMPAEKVASPSNLPDADTRAIDVMLASVVDQALTPGEAHGIMRFLCKADQQRFASGDKPTPSDLETQVTRFRNDWKAKYGEDVKLQGHEQTVFQNVRLQGGEWGDNAHTASERIAPADQTTNPPRVQTGVQSQQGVTGAESLIQGTPGRPVPPDTSATPPGGAVSTGTTANQGRAQVAGQRLEAAAGDATVTNKPAGEQHRATLYFPAPAQDQNPNNAARGGFALNLVREDGSWHIALPTSETHEQLHERLVRHVARLEDMKGSWPDNQDAARVIVARQILRSFSPPMNAPYSGSDVRNGINPSATPAPQQR